MSRPYAACAIAFIAFTSLFSQAVRAADDVFEGKVVNVVEGTLMIMGKTNNDNKAFTVNAETKVTRNGKPGKLSDVQVGDKAKVTATAGTGTSMVAKEIIANSPEGMRYARIMWR